MKTGQFSYLHQLYQFYTVIQSTDLLKTEVMKAIEVALTLIHLISRIVKQKSSPK